MADLHHVRIRIPAPQAYFTRVELDGQLVKGLVGVSLQSRIGSDLRDPEEPLVVLTIAPQAVDVDAIVGLHVLDHERTDRRRRHRLSLFRRSWRQRIHDAWHELTRGLG